ncbi:uncharacterized protein LOC132405624 isoform X2 [Hypanus sabinus]|uniref:uncharacterized protein LOC132405624 isoform X2 n=1 Tax=Hypanus sabinus TaxID=79690 RepID=UPI0028C458D6|nr:uncharacterized protein LOC132405624 isoform X2 [Hypanus sabinus]
MCSAWKPYPVDGRPQNSLAAKGFRSVRPKFLESAKKPALQHSDQNVKDNTKDSNDITEAKDFLSSDLSNQGTHFVSCPSNITHDNESEPKDKKSNSLDSKMDLNPNYKVKLQSTGQKMNTANVLTTTSVMISEKGCSHLIPKKPLGLSESQHTKQLPSCLVSTMVPSEDRSKTWYSSILKSDHSIPKADNYGLSSNIDTKWEANPTKQPSSNSATVNKSRSQLTRPLSYNSTIKENYTIKCPFLSEARRDSDHEQQNGSIQSLYPRPEREQSASNPLSVNPYDSQNSFSSRDYHYTRPKEILPNSLAAKELHSHFFATANPEENYRSLPNGKIDTHRYHIEPANVFAYEPEKSSVSDYGLHRSRQNRTLGDICLHKTRSFPALEAATSQLTLRVPIQPNGPGTDPDQCLEIRHDSTNLPSVDTENDKNKNNIKDTVNNANLSCQSQKQELQEEIFDLKQQRKMEWIVRVKYDFHGQTSKELPVKKGDIVFIHRQRDNNWYEGECNGKRGLLPICYVEPTSELQPHKDTIEELAIAKFRFSALSNIELPLEKDQTVVLLRRIDENWYEGKYPGTNRKGIFPVTYVEVIGKPLDPIWHKEHATSASDLKIETASQWSLHQLHQRNVNNKNIQHSEEIYLALYSFAPNKDDELELREGDLVSVISKWDDGWYLGFDSAAALIKGGLLQYFSASCW